MNRIHSAKKYYSLDLDPGLVTLKPVLKLLKDFSQLSNSSRFQVVRALSSENPGFSISLLTRAVRSLLAPSQRGSFFHSSYSLHPPPTPTFTSDAPRYTYFFFYQTFVRQNLLEWACIKDMNLEENEGSKRIIFFHEERVIFFERLSNRTQEQSSHLFSRSSK